MEGLNIVKTGGLVQRLNVANQSIAIKFSKIARDVAGTKRYEKLQPVSKLAMEALGSVAAFFISLTGLALTGLAYLLEGVVAVALSPVILGTLAVRNKDKLEISALKIKDFIQVNSTLAKATITGKLGAVTSSLNTISKDIKERGGVLNVIGKFATTGYLPSKKLNFSKPSS